MLTTALIIFNLFILESLLSVDNAAVLAVMVKDLPSNQRNKALRYGILGAYVFRGLMLFFAAWLVKIIWLKIIGGLYLFYLVYGFFVKSNSDEKQSEAKESKIYIFSKNKLRLNQLWATIILVELMDLAFSIDNVFAAVAMTNIFWIIMVGVAIGIAAMRFVAGWFVRLIKKYPSLETSAFIVIALLGTRLVLSGIAQQFNIMQPLNNFIEQSSFNYIFSGTMMVIFFAPLLLQDKKPLNTSDSMKSISTITLMDTFNL